MGAIKEKTELYKILVSIPEKMLSNSEVDIMYALSRDREIQEQLEKHKKESNNGSI